MHGRVSRALTLAAALVLLTAGAALGLFPVNAHIVEGDFAPSLRPIVAVPVKPTDNLSVRHGPAIEGATSSVPVSATSGTFQLGMSATSATFPLGRRGGPTR